MATHDRLPITPTQYRRTPRRHTATGVTHQHAGSSDGARLARYSTIVNVVAVLALRLPVRSSTVMTSV